jgi:hypothetical protein
VDQKHVERSDEDADFEWDAEQQIESDGGADHLRQVGRADCDFGKDPQQIADRLRKGITARLSEVAPRGEAKARTKCLQ